MDRDGWGLDQFKQPHKVNTTPSLKDLYQHITPQYTADWEVIGTLLGLPSGELKAIEAGWPSNVKWCCNQMLKKWLEMDTTASWGKLLIVIESPAVSCSAPDKATLLTSKLDQMITGNEAIAILSNRVSQINVHTRFMVSDNKWPPEGETFFTPLLLIYHQGYHSLKQITAITKLMFSGDIDKIASATGEQSTINQDGHEKFPATKEIAEILYPLENKESTFILIEGAPGIGKSVLLKEISYRWAKKQLLQKFELVLLVFLGDPSLQRIQSINDLLQLFCKRDENARQIVSVCAEHLYANGGKTVAFLLDGYDDYPEDLQRSSLISDILERNVLPFCGLIVTSRSHDSLRIHKLATTKVEILGFTETEREYYIKQALQDQPHKIRELTKYLHEQPSFDSLCFIPFILHVLLYLYKCGFTLPKNCTELYNHIICSTIRQHFFKYGNQALAFNLTDLTNLPEPCNRIIKQLSKLSLESLYNDKLYFRLDEIMTDCPDIVTVPGAINGFGLLHAVQHFDLYSKTITLSFMHFTIQDFLAAHYISFLAPNESFKIIKANFWSDTHFNMFSMYVSLTKGQQDSFKKFLSNGNKAITISNEILENRLKCIRLYYFFNEAGDYVACNNIEKAEIFMSRELEFTTVGASDMKCISLFLTSSSYKIWKKLQLCHCSIHDKGLIILYQRLRHASNITINQLWLSNNMLTTQSVFLISELTVKCKVKILVINDNITIGEDEKLYSMLTNPSNTLEQLCMSNVKLSSRAGISLFTALKDNNKLKELNIEDNAITDDACDAITTALQSNGCLVKLGMHHNPLSSEAISNIMQCLKANNTLNLLGLPDCPRDIQDDIKILQNITNKNRESQGCQVRLKIKIAFLIWDKPEGDSVAREGLTFDGYTILNAFNVLSSNIFEVTTESYNMVNEWSKQYCDEHWHDESFNWNVSSMDELFKMLNGSSYFNPFNPGLLKFLANKYRNGYLINSVKNYEEEFLYHKIEDLDFLGEIIVIGNDISAEFSTSIVSTLKKTMTIGELWNFCTPKLTKHTTNAHNSLINAGTLILDPSERLLNLYYSIKDNETFLAKAKQENQVVDFQHIKILLTGSAAAGKTSFRHLLFRSKYSSEYKSTEVMEAQHATSIVNFTMLKQETNKKEEVIWLKLDPKNQIAHFKTLLKSGAFHQANTEGHPESGSEILQHPASTFDDDNHNNVSSCGDYNEHHDDDGHSDGNSHKDGHAMHGDDHDDGNGDGLDDDDDENADDASSRIVSDNGVAFTVVEKKVLSSETLPETMKIDKRVAMKLITVIDSGGQPEYINMLPAINSCPTINFVVLDMTKDLDDLVMVHYKSEHNKNFKDYPLHYSNLDMIGLLVSLTTDSLQQPTNEQTPSLNKSYIGFVGTHKDVLEKSKQLEEKISRINDKLTKLTKGRIPVLAAENGVLFPVDNTTAGDSESEDHVVKKLRQKIEKEINKLQSVNQLKISWMILEFELQELHQNDGTKFINYEKYREIAIEKASMVPEEVEESLHHFDLLGVFLRYKTVEGLCDYVIIDHQWLFNSLAMIMHLSPDDIDFEETEYREQFKAKGLLAKTELPSVKWDGELCLEYFFDLLIHLKVIATVTLDDVVYYYMPCVFHSTKQYNDKYRFLYSEPLLVQFSSGFLPRGFFCSLVVHLLEKLPTGWEPQLDNIEHFSNVITFELPDDMCRSFLRLHDKISYLEIQIRHYKGDLDISNHSNIFHELSCYFTEVCNKLNFDHKKLQYGFLCHDGKSNDDHIAVIKPFQFPLPSEVKCCRECPHRTKLGKLHNIWLKEAAGGASDHDHPKLPNAGPNTDLHQLLNQKPEMKDINKIVVPRIQAEWEDVAFALRYEISRVDAIKANNKDNSKKCCKELFINWLSTKHGVGPKTWSTLIKELKEISDLEETIKEIEELAKKLVNS